MKITHLCLAGTITDGWSYQENMLSKYHKKLGYEVSIITSRWVYDDKNSLYKFPENDYYLENGVHVIRLDIINKDDLTYKFKKYSGVEESLERLKPDILFIHGCQFVDIPNVIRYLKKNKETVVYVDNHADFSNSATNFISRRVLHGIIWKYYAQSILPYVTKFYGVLPSRVTFLKDVYHIPAEKIDLLVMGGDDDLVENAIKNREITRAKYNILKEDFLVVTGGKIDKWKKQTLLLLQAINNIRKNKVKLIFFGSIDTELKDSMEKLTDGKKIQYIGWVNVETSYDLFAAADLAVFPGRHSVYWEQAAAQGVPMIVRDWPGTHHIDFGNNVIYLYQDSEVEIQNAILSLIEDKNKYQKMLCCAKDNMKVFSYMDIAKRSVQK